MTLSVGLILIKKHEIGRICPRPPDSNQFMTPDLSDKNVHLGFIFNNSFTRLENHILLIFKRFLFEDRKGKFIVNLYGFILEVFDAYTKDRIPGCKQKGKPNGHFQKWNTTSDVRPP